MESLAGLAEYLPRAMPFEVFRQVVLEARLLLKDSMRRLFPSLRGVTPVERQFCLAVRVDRQRAGRSAEAAHVEQALPVRIFVVDDDEGIRSPRSELFREPLGAAQDVSAHLFSPF
ncbi:hypothetical protein SDC9_147188 [bioreactor metagenome]|uniref:Uncharacterized protein n=1 Tax=bioreactor metagenome TaxID=1076179 RepID=A0A645EGV9_9ZZZZ